MKSTTIQTGKKVLQHSKKVINLFPLALFLTALILITNNTAMAQQLVCPERSIQQITNDPVLESERPDINSPGSYIAFDSDSNINGGNPNNNTEVFLYDTTTDVFTQITDTTSGFNITASISDDANIIAFESTANITGQNPDGSREIVFFNRATSTFTQITDDPNTGNRSRQPSVSDDGDFIAFRSEFSINGGNPENNNEIYLYNVNTGVITQITTTMTGESYGPSISADGTYISFESEADISGLNPEMNRDMFLFNTSFSSFTNLTNATSGDSFNGKISSDGQYVAFVSRSPLTPLFISGNQVYVVNTTTGAITQITNVDGNGSFPSPNADGSIISFDFGGNLNGGNPEGNKEVYVYDMSNGVITQITQQTTGDSDDPSINGNGSLIAFESNANINGGNPNGEEEIYLATCFIPEPIPTLSEWGLIAMASILGIAGFMVIRRRKATA